MSPSRQPSHDSLKPFKLFHHLLPTDRPCYSSTGRRSIGFLIPLAICCFVVSISLLLLSSGHPKPLAGSFWFLPTATIHSSSSACLIPHRPTVDSPVPTNLSHLFFGLGGSAKTWHQRNHYSELWWDRATTRGFLWLDEAPSTDITWPDTSPPYRVSTGPTNRPPSSSSSSNRIALILKESFLAASYEEEEVRWFVMGDDDTVFFKENLVGVLSRYDHRRMWYVGGSSESVEQDVKHSYQTAFGGGGYAISYPLACQMTRVLDACVERYRDFYGSDEKVSACVSEFGVSLTREPGFHQLDIRDDPYGFLAAHPVAPLVSLHHLDDIKPLFPNKTQLESLTSVMEAYRADPARTLQQSICYDRSRDWSVSISWGYTAQLYPYLVTARELEIPLQTFRTWRSWSDGPFLFQTRPLQPDHCDQQPVVYYLYEVEEASKGSSTTTTVYKKAAVESGKSCDHSDYKNAERMEEIIATAEKLDLQEWMKEPRRQCCEITNVRDNDKETIMRVTLRRCKPGESISV